jgi:hypothetical protein
MGNKTSTISNKPLVIFEKHYVHTIQMLVRIDNKNQSKYIIQFLDKVLHRSTKKVKEIHSDLKTIGQHPQQTFFSNRLVHRDISIDYFVNDEGRVTNTCFIFFVIDFKKISIPSYQIEKYFSV